MKLLALLVLSLSGEEAIAACDGKPVGAACVVTLSDGPHAGTCLGAPATCMPVPPSLPAN